jgi:uracil-DNA glycosylase
MPESSAIGQLISDIKERLLFMEELGVDALDAKLAVPAPETEDIDSPPARVELPKALAPTTAEAPRRSIASALPSLSAREKPAKGAWPVLDPPSTRPAASPPASQLFGEPVVGLPSSNESLEEIRQEIGNCTRCPLYTGRTKVVHSTGSGASGLMFVGEAPGADEDEQGYPFVGRAGQLLTKMIESISLRREDVFIGNINRCRPPGNRAPTTVEAHTCRPFLLREIAVVRPRVVVVLGNTALHNLLDTKVGITRVRGRFQDYHGVKVMPTFHPAYLLRDPNKKRDVWEDLKVVRDYLNSGTLPEGQ